MKKQGLKSISIEQNIINKIAENDMSYKINEVRTPKKNLNRKRRDGILPNSEQMIFRDFLLFVDCLKRFLNINILF